MSRLPGPIGTYRACLFLRGVLETFFLLRRYRVKVLPGDQIPICILLGINRRCSYGPMNRFSGSRPNHMDFFSLGLRHGSFLTREEVYFIYIVYVACTTILKLHRSPQAMLAFGTTCCYLAREAGHGAEKAARGKIADLPKMRLQTRRTCL